MPNYRRPNTPGTTWFFTLVTHQRQRFLAQDNGIAALRQSIKAVKSVYPFDIDGWVLLPDHMHFIWTLPENDFDFSKRIGMMKAKFTSSMRSTLEKQFLTNSSRANRREGTIWQRRFWEHQIRDDDDLEKHLDYIHFNPVKHRVVNTVCDWPYSTFHRFVDEGIYTRDWAGSGIVEGSYGE